jgi:hypothetical protein
MRPLPKQILTFLLLMFAFSSLPYYLIIHTGHIGALGDVVRWIRRIRHLRAVQN